MKSLYRQFVDLVKQNAFEQAERIHREYGKNASYIYPSYGHVVLGIIRMLEQTIHVPAEIIKDIIAVEGMTSKLGEVALFSHAKDEDSE